MLIRKHVNWTYLITYQVKHVIVMMKSKKNIKKIVDYRPWATIQRITCCKLINKLK